MIIDDTPEVVVISGFDPVRREIARLSLERLIQNGRIHPARIEEVVEKITKEIEETMLEEGEKAAYSLGIPGLHKDALYNVGKLKFRTSYGQDVLAHSIEVANLAGIMAGELGLDVQLAKRAGLLHDVGKGSIVEGEGAHAIVGAEMAKKFGESEKCINIIASHHNDRDPESFEAVLVSSCRCYIGFTAREQEGNLLIHILNVLRTLKKSRLNLKVLRKLSLSRQDANSASMVDNTLVSDERAEQMARDIAQKIESELKYPGIVRVTVIRETRVIDYAR